MNPILICTVGGSHEPIVKAIQDTRPERVCFICSDEDPASGQKGSYVQISSKGNVIKARFSDTKPSLPNIPAQAGLGRGGSKSSRFRPTTSTTCTTRRWTGSAASPRRAQ